MSIKNDIYLRTLRGETVERPPVWLMRQAGRILPQYRAIRASLGGFKELLHRPDLAAEVTIQPVDELNVDAAIIFSDILVIPEAMGLNYELVEKKGPRFLETISKADDVNSLISGIDAAEKLNYVFEALKITKKNLEDRVPLIGFSGAPWTLMAYMIEGQGSKTFAKAKKFLYQEPKATDLLLEKITDTIIAYCKLKISFGADAIQIFDSWASMLSPQIYEKFMLKHFNRICEEISEVPVILFCKGAHHALPHLAKMDCQALGLDWTISPKKGKTICGTKILQGNMDPCLLYAKPEEINKSCLEMMKNFEHSHIVNLGHGVYPDTPLEGVKTFVNTVKSYKYFQ